MSMYSLINYLKTTFYYVTAFQNASNPALV
jgi:hypothetical protein